VAKRESKRTAGNLDRTDCAIIKLLQADGRLSNIQIAKKLAISESTVRTRLNRLLEEEFIRIVAVSNPMKLGFGVIGSIRIDVDINKVVHITRELEKLKPIWFIVHATGDSDIYTEFLVKSLDELNELIFEKISKIDGIIRTNTSIIIKFIKRNYQWGTGLY
jgi:Lrp/AsnC family transcriptional regulator for asnA, asnC and gidA